MSVYEEVDERKIEDKIREGCLIYDAEAPNLYGRYRGIFLNGNFFLYRHVNRTMNFRDESFNDDILVLVYSNITKPVRNDQMPPMMVSANKR
jgi:hypothetical protein